MIINLKMNGIEIALAASETIEQDFSPIVGESLRRLNNGAAVKATTFSGKTRISTSGSGRLPLPLSSVNFALPVVMECSTPISAHSMGNSVALPAGFTHEAVNYNSWRGDVSMIGHAIVGGNLVHSAITEIAGNVVSLTAINGASGYQVTYWPRFLVFANKPREAQGLRGGGKRSWDFVAETV